ncbi:MAG: hypothetical protein HQL63_06160 [Magnetococcales bacterium]|nr:hypothetical protein [Magnetococcales bacterium]MBF0321343.1 hypothetical protein [Magnetococcales bacterium]
MFHHFFAIPAALIGSLYVALLMADLAVAVLFTQPPRQTGALYQQDPERGHAHTPGFRGEIFTRYPFWVGINRHGYRGDEWRFHESFRVAVLGDSFVFGEPLPIAEGFVAKAAARFDDHVGYYNLGVSGYGPAHHEVTLARECPVIRPRAVYYMFYLNDTAWDNIRADATTILNGHVVHTMDRHGHRLTRETLLKKLEEARSQETLYWADVVRLHHVSELILSRIRVIGNKGDPAVRFRQTTSPDHSPEDIERAARIIQKIDFLARECGADFTMIILPSRWEARFGVVEPATERLLALLDKANAKLDLLDLRRTASKEHDLGMPKDDHYNPQATTWVAEEMTRHLLVRHPELHPFLRP